MLVDHTSAKEFRPTEEVGTFSFEEEKLDNGELHHPRVTPSYVKLYRLTINASHAFLASIHVMFQINAMAARGRATKAKYSQTKK